MLTGELVLVLDDRLERSPQYIPLGKDDQIMLVPDEVRKCVVFLCFKANDGIIKLAGTAFFVSLRYTDLDGAFGYVVTAKHVIDGIKNNSIDQMVYLRVNTIKGDVAQVITHIASWMHHPQNQAVDVSVLPWAPPPEVMDFRMIPTTMAATNEVIEKESIGVGDEVFLTGLFVNHYGRQRNQPIVRIGNIALMPAEPIHTSNLGDIDAYLIEARSIGGLSGSPVFVHLAGIRRIGMNNKIVGDRFYWLGLMHGHWNVSEEDIDVVQDKTNQSVNMGIAIVVPVTKILEVINQEALMKQREKHEKERKDKQAPIADINKDNKL